MSTTASTPTPTREGAKPTREAFRQNVQVAMAKRSMNRTDLAKALEVDATWVTRRLNGLVKVDLDDLDRLAVVLDTTPAELVAEAAR